MAHKKELKLEIGRTYIDREYDEVLIVAQHKGLFIGFMECTGLKQVFLYTGSGSALEGGCEGDVSPLDLVCEKSATSDNVIDFFVKER